MCRQATAYELIHFSLNFTLDIFANVIFTFIELFSNDQKQFSLRDLKGIYYD